MVDPGSSSSIGGQSDLCHHVRLLFPDPLLHIGVRCGGIPLNQDGGQAARMRSPELEPALLWCAKPWPAKPCTG